MGKYHRLRFPQDLLHIKVTIMQTSRLWMIPFSYTAYAIALQFMNAMFIVNDKPTMALGYTVSWWFCILIFLAWMILEVVISVILKMVED